MLVHETRQAYLRKLPFVYSFITFRSARHLDGKHTVFGRIVGGLDVLDRLEKVETDKQDKPKVGTKRSVPGDENSSRQVRNL